MLERAVEAPLARLELANVARAERSLAFERLELALADDVVRLLLAEEVVQRVSSIATIVTATITTPTPACWNARKSRPANGALPTMLMPTQPKLPNISATVGHWLRLRYGTAVMSAVLRMK
jgi:hypothetical protein